MVDFARTFYQDRQVRPPTPFFSRPGIVLPVQTPPVAGFISVDDSFSDIDERPTRVGMGGGHGRGVLQRGKQSFPGVLDLSGQFYQKLFWNDRVHLIPTRNDIGSIITTVSSSYDLYNAGSKPVTITSILQNGLSGVTFTGGTLVTPFVLGGKETEEYDYDVSPLGDPNLDASVVYTVDSGVQTLTHSITGSRVVFLSLPPQKPILEGFQFLTDIIGPMQDGTEQRRSLRDRPRQWWNYRWRLDEDDRAYFENQLYDWGKRTFAVPLWTEEVELTSDVLVGATALPVTTTLDRDFFNGGFAALRTDRDTFEVVAIGPGQTPTSLPLTAGLQAAFDAGTSVFPVRSMVIRGAIRQNLFKAGVGDFDITWDQNENRTYDDLTQLTTTYKGLRVWEDDIEIVGTAYEQAFDLRNRRYDSGIARFAQENFDAPPQFGVGAIKTMDTHAEYIRGRKILLGFNGRQKTVWFPTQRDDFTIHTDQGIGVLIIANFANWTRHMEGQPTRQDIRIQYADGTIDYREITGAVDNGDGSETLTIDSTSSQTLTMANVFRISLMRRMRLGIDNIDFTHERFGIVRTNFTLVEVIQ